MWALLSNGFIVYLYRGVFRAGPPIAAGFPPAMIQKFRKKAIKREFQEFKFIVKFVLKKRVLFKINTKITL